MPVAESAAMREVLGAAEDVAMGNTTVLVLGESGTGKEVIARYIHRCSPRASGPWVAVNCAAMPAELLESELFGHERGAFTGAAERRVGRIEQADKGTLLLDEISELPPPLQAKLLRVLQEREVDRLGGGRPVPVDVRIIATSNRDLGQMVERKLFRADLYYRLFVFPIVLPPLRDRPDDIPGARRTTCCASWPRISGRPVPTLADDALRGLARYRFPGNVRELGNILERALVRCRLLGHRSPVSRSSASTSHARASRRWGAPSARRCLNGASCPRACRSISARWSGWRFKKRCAARTATARARRASWASACARCATSCASTASARPAIAASDVSAPSADGQIVPTRGGRRTMSGPIVDAAASFAEVPEHPSSARGSHLVPAHKEQAA